MKIGILTFHSYDNYGAVLQAYALQTYLKKSIDIDVEIINFCTKSQQKTNRIFEFYKVKSFRELAILLMNKLPILVPLIIRRKKFSKFRRKYFVLTGRYKTYNELIQKLPVEDIYVTGSDQVFNPNGKYTDVYYLGFDKRGAKKVGYAPSFGISNIEKYIGEKLQNYLADFDSLSCREQVGAEYLSNLLHREIPRVADPVFLLKKEEWQRILEIPKAIKKNKRKFIFVFNLNGGDQLMQLARKISVATGMPLICLAMNKQYKTNAQMLYGIGPTEILGLISKASYVVTDSFHGTALSLVFHKEVIPYIATPKTSTRITSLMESFDRINNVVYDAEKFDFNKLCFKGFDSNMEDYTRTSEEFLLNSVIRQSSPKF